MAVPSVDHNHIEAAFATALGAFGEVLDDALYLLATQLVGSKIAPQVEFY
jgi:hypothetical protein